MAGKFKIEKKAGKFKLYFKYYGTYVAIIWCCPGSGGGGAAGRGGIISLTAHVRHTTEEMNFVFTYVAQF